MITYYFRTVKDQSLQTLEQSRSGVWAHVVAPTETELTTLEQTYALDEGVMEDVTDFYEVPRLEINDGVVYLFTRYPLSSINEDTNTAPILFVLGPSYVVTIAQYDVPPIDALLAGDEPTYTTQKSKLFLQLMDAVTTAFDKELLRLRKQVHKDRIRLRSIGTRDIERLVVNETKLNSMVDALVPTNAALQKILKSNYITFYTEDREMVEDVVIANDQVVNSARSVLKTIQNIRSATEAIMSSRLNNALRILTVLTIMLTIPLVIPSIYGMNVPLPAQDEPYIFSVIVGVNLLFMLTLAIVLRKNNWF